MAELLWDVLPAPVAVPSVVSARTANGDVPTGSYYLTVGGERLDQIAYEVYGIQSGAVEALLIVNPRLADQPYLLPANLAILLPTLTAKAATAKTREVLLWG